MTAPATYVSFLVRMWCEKSPGLPETTADWHSEIEHIQSGRRFTFCTLDELLGFLRRQAEGLGHDAVTSEGVDRGSRQKIDGLGEGK